MATHKISLTLTTQQLMHLNEALKEHLRANDDALASESFSDDYAALFNQCQALQIFLDTVKSIVDEVDNA